MDLTKHSLTILKVNLSFLFVKFTCLFEKYYLHLQRKKLLNVCKYENKLFISKQVPDNWMDSVDTGCRIRLYDDV